MKIKDVFSFIRGKQLNTQFSIILPTSRWSLGASVKERKNLTEYRNWVFACVQARSEAVGDIDLRLIKGEDETEENELLDLLFKVNPTMTMKDLFVGTQAFLDLDGNAFWFLARDKNGEGDIKEIWLLRPDNVQIIQSKENPLLVSGYVYNQQGQKIPFKANEILHFKNFNPLGNHPFPHRGMSVVEAAEWAIQTDNEARVWNYSFFKNSARPDGMLIKDSPAEMSDEEYKRLRAQFEQEYQTSLNAHKPLILSGGLKWQDLARSQKDMDFLAQRTFGRDEILALFRTPKSVIGIVEDVNRSNAEASNFVFADRTIKPLMQRIVDTLNEFLVPEFGDDLWLHFTSPVPEDRTQVIAEYTAGIDKWFSRNEIRQKEGLPPTQEGNKFFGTLAQIPIDETTEPIKQSPKPRIKKKKKESEIDKIINDFVAEKMKKDETKPARELTELAVKNYIQIWKAFFDVEPKPFAKDLDNFLVDQEKEVLKNIKEETKALEPAEYSIKAPEDFIYNRRTAVATGIRLITPRIRSWLKTAGEQAFLITGATGTYDPTTPEGLEFLTERAALFSRTFDETTADKLLKEIEIGLDEKETPEQLSERVSVFYDQERDYRSDRAARTEASASANFAGVDAYKQAGVTKKRWLVVDPEDDDCLSLDGDVVDIDAEFRAVSGETFDQPPVHPNCVCTTLPVFE